jgi:hypothetical protein
LRLAGGSGSSGVPRAKAGWRRRPAQGAPALPRRRGRFPVQKRGGGGGGGGGAGPGTTWEATGAPPSACERGNGSDGSKDEWLQGQPTKQRVLGHTPGEASSRRRSCPWSRRPERRPAERTQRLKGRRGERGHGRKATRSSPTLSAHEALATRATSVASVSDRCHASLSPSLAGSLRARARAGGGHRAGRELHSRRVELWRGGTAARRASQQSRAQRPASCAQSQARTRPHCTRPTRVVSRRGAEPTC